MTFTIARTSPEFDADLILCDGRQVGYIGKGSGDIGLESCPRCHHENYAIAVATGVCAWCEFDLKEAARGIV